ncbi:hypothetical protein LCGC14_2096380 [marine sediment metagenome]|uniref:PD(D/E)XK endonuclease domain-containing protein n=1 Tax=marine sediment metagenome TaxID=412755 RepID=A0A0F9EYL3_9ZZZZ
MNTKAIGEISQACIMASLLKAGYAVLTPYGDNLRYDLVIEKGGEFFRVQCKTGRLDKGAIVFPTASSYRHRNGSNRHYRGQIEYFAVYYPDNDTTYLVPVDEVGVSTAALRLEAPKNNQVKNVRFAETFKI